MSLWHPLGEDAETIHGWRDWIIRNKVTQPFKQAHRPVFTLDGERADSPESSRLSGQLLRDSVWRSRLEVLGWKHHYGESPVRHEFALNLPDEGMSVRFLLMEIKDETGVHPGRTYAESGPILFFRRSKQKLVLSKVPPIIYSEVLAHVDSLIDGLRVDFTEEHLFKMCPNSWSRQASDELTESGRTCREIARAILPGIKQLKDCVIDGSYLVIKGQVNEYRIHLNGGATQILPGKRLLSLDSQTRYAIAEQSKDITLPYDGDYRLKYILGLAMMLSNESRIKNPGILQQIKASPPQSS